MLIRAQCRTLRCEKSNASSTTIKMIMYVAFVPSRKILIVLIINVFLSHYAIGFSPLLTNWQPDRLSFALYAERYVGNAKKSEVQSKDFNTESERKTLSLQSNLDERNVYTGSTQEYPKTKKKTVSDGAHKRKPDYIKDVPNTVAWHAGYRVSRLTQKKIQQASINQAHNQQGFTSSSVISTLLQTKPEQVNEVNIMCAFNLSAKALLQSDSRSAKRQRENVELLSHLNGLLELVTLMLASKRLTFRQLANAAWSAAKYTTYIKEFPWEDKIVSKSLTKLSNLLLEIAAEVNKILKLDKHESLKPGELAMIVWAYSAWKPKRIPTGWIWPPTDARMPLATKESSDSFLFERQTIFQSEDDRILRKQETREDHDYDKIAELMGLVARELSDDSHTLNRATSKQQYLKQATWSELANFAWSFAHSECTSNSQDTENFLISISNEASIRLKNPAHGMVPLPRDLSIIAWSLGVQQADNYALGDSLESFCNAICQHEFEYARTPFQFWKPKDLVQLCQALAHAAIDDRKLLAGIYNNAYANLDAFRNWEITILLWAQARLHLTGTIDSIYSEFTSAAVQCLLRRVENNSKVSSGLGPQEQANLAWALTVLEEYKDESESLLKAVFKEAAHENTHMTLEHAHQLWQAMFLLQKEFPEAVAGVPSEFSSWLEARWKEEKSRSKLSSQRHKKLSETLNNMRVAHYNEHDEDIDVAIVLKKESGWTSSASTEHGLSKDIKHRVAVEFDGITHFIRNGKRPLGHTVLKYRLLKQQGWTVVRVPHYEFDKIPTWASMERQRYLQRLLKTHENLKFSGADTSSYKALTPNRKSRFD